MFTLCRKIVLFHFHFCLLHEDEIVEALFLFYHCNLHWRPLRLLKVGLPLLFRVSYLRLPPPQLLSLRRLECVQLPPFPLSLLCRHLLLLIQHLFFINHLWWAQDSRRSWQKSSRILCPENLWSLTSFCLLTLCLQSPNHSCCSMGA